MPLIDKNVIEKQRLNFCCVVYLKEMGRIEYLRQRISQGSERSVETKKNIIISLLTKVASIIASLLIVPMTIRYVNPTQYGIWLTLSSTISWILFFDLGLGNGFRNKFAEAKAKGNTLLARQYLSTTYFAIGAIVIFLCIIALTLNSFLDWSSILNLDVSYKTELRKVFVVLIVVTCTNMVVNVFTALLNADQKPGWSGIINAVGQYLSLLVICLLTFCTEGSLLTLALFYSGIPCLTLLFASVILFNRSHLRAYSPKIRFVRLSLVKNILQFGIRFFMIYMCLIAIFQIVNIVITREIGPIGVTQYNITNKYFNILYMFCNIIITPFWSAFTDAYTKKDFEWMTSMVNKLQRCWYLMCVIGIVMLLFSPIFYMVWIGSKVDIPFLLSIAMFFLICCQSLGSIYMNLINGIGAVKIQLITYIIFAVLSWPLFTISAHLFGLVGIIAIPAFVYLVQGILGRIQICKILKGSAHGIWME